MSEEITMHRMANFLPPAPECLLPATVVADSLWWCGQLMKDVTLQARLIDI
jgi:hypothetical protein